MSKPATDPLRSAYDLLHSALGDWWTKDRRNWCAYCGIQMRARGTKGMPTVPQKATKDHVISRKHKGNGLTIPACSSCNQAKDAMSLQEFVLSDYFVGKSQGKHKNKWSIERLWIVTAMAALKQAGVK